MKNIKLLKYILLIMIISNISLSAKENYPYNLSKEQMLKIKKVYEYGNSVGLEKEGDLSTLGKTLVSMNYLHLPTKLVEE